MQQIIVHTAPYKPVDLCPSGEEVTEVGFASWTGFKVAADAEVLTGGVWCCDVRDALELLLEAASAEVVPCIVAMWGMRGST